MAEALDVCSRMLTYAEQALVMAEALEQYGTTEGVVSTLLSRSRSCSRALSLCLVSVCRESEGVTARERARARAERHALCGG